MSRNKIVNQTAKWKIKQNELKSVHINFTNKKITDPILLEMNGTIVPHETSAKYFGMTLDTKLRWKEHIKKKRAELDLKYRQ